MTGKLSVKLGVVMDGANGLKTVQISDPHDEPVVLSPSSSLSLAYRVTSFNNESATRLNLSLIPDAEVESLIAALDSAILEQLPRIMPQLVNPGEKPVEYVSPLSSTPTTLRLLRTKIMTTGARAVRCWDEQKQRLPIPEDWLCYVVKPRISVRSLVAAEGKLYPVLETTDAMLTPIQISCPF
jgi:hypothetical protein